MIDGSYVLPVRTAAPSGLAAPAGRAYGPCVRAVRAANADKPTSVRAVRTADPSGLAVRTYDRTSGVHFRQPYVQAVRTALHPH